MNNLLTIQAIENIRKDLNITQMEMADIAMINRSSYIGMVRRGDAKQSVLQRLTDYLSATVSSSSLISIGNASRAKRLSELLSFSGGAENDLSFCDIFTFVFPQGKVVTNGEAFGVQMGDTIYTRCGDSPIGEYKPYNSLIECFTINKSLA